MNNFSKIKETLISEGKTELKVGDKVSYTSLRSGKRKRTGKIEKIKDKNGRTVYELDNGAIIDDGDIL